MTASFTDLSIVSFFAKDSFVLFLLLRQRFEGYSSFASWGDATPDLFVEASIDGTSRSTETIWDDKTPQWSHTLDMGCPSDENEPLTLVLIEVCSTASITEVS